MRTDGYAVLALLCALALMATLRISFVSEKAGRWPLVLRALSSTIWLLPMLVLGNLTLGILLTGRLSPWPPSSFEIASLQAGPWAGTAAALATTVTDLWLLYTLGQMVIRLNPENRGATMRYLPLFNLLIGGALLAFSATR